VQTLSSLEPAAPLSSSVLFALISAVAGLGPTLVLYGLAFIPGRVVGEYSVPSIATGWGAAIALGALVLGLAMQLGAFFVYAGLDHLALKLLGASSGSFEVTARAQALSMGPYGTRRRTPMVGTKAVESLPCPKKK
jgi:hypothetical protein